MGETMGDDQFKEWDKFNAKVEKHETAEGALQAYKYDRAKEQGLRGDGKSPGGQSLASHHAKLNAEGYVPPKPKEIEPKYVGRIGKHQHKLTDQQAMFCRDNVGRLGVKELAKRYGVSYEAMLRITQGLTYKHLNIRPKGKLE